MTGGALVLALLLVSWTSLMLQAVAAVHMWRQRAASTAERIAGHGYARTAACRVLAAVVYFTAALLDILGVRVPGAGVLGPEALVIFTGVQLLWITNAALDIRVRHQLAHTGQPRKEPDA